MSKHNDFCVNDKVLGSCWGIVIVDLSEFDILTTQTSIVMVYKKVLNDWNGKNYMWFKDMQYDDLTGDNYFLEIPKDGLKYECI